MTLLGVAIGAGTLAGCANNQPEPQAEEQPKQQEPAPDSEPTKEPTPEAPELPEKLDKPYVHVVLDFFEGWHDSMDDGDVDAFMQYTRDGCQSCEGMADTISDAVAKGGAVESAGMEPVLASKRNLAAEHSDTEATVIIHYREGEFTLIEEADSKPQVEPEREVDMQVDLVREGDTWLIDEIFPEEVQK